MEEKTIKTIKAREGWIVLIGIVFTLGIFSLLWMFLNNPIFISSVGLNWLFWSLFLIGWCLLGLMISKELFRYKKPSDIFLKEFIIFSLTAGPGIFLMIRGSLHNLTSYNQNLAVYGVFLFVYGYPLCIFIRFIIWAVKKSRR